VLAVKLGVFVFIVMFCFKYNKVIKNKKAAFIDNGVNESQFNLLIVFTWLYLAPLLLAMVFPSILMLLLFLPGIIMGYRISKKLDVSGIDTGVYAGRDAANNMWLGIGALLFVFFSGLL